MSDDSAGRVKQRHGMVSAYSFDEWGNPRGTVGISVSSVALTGTKLPPRYSIVLQDGAGLIGYDMTIDAAEALVEILTAATARLKALRAEEVIRER